jgi:hypothetical protein
MGFSKPCPIEPQVLLIQSAFIISIHYKLNRGLYNRSLGINAHEKSNNRTWGEMESLNKLKFLKKKNYFFYNVNSGVVAVDSEVYH